MIFIFQKQFPKQKSNTKYPVASRQYLPSSRPPARVAGRPVLRLVTPVSQTIGLIKQNNYFHRKRLFLFERIDVLHRSGLLLRKAMAFIQKRTQGNKMGRTLGGCGGAYGEFWQALQIKKNRSAAPPPCGCFVYSSRPSRTAISNLHFPSIIRFFDLNIFDNSMPACPLA